jgi:hypothetical protein
MYVASLSEALHRAPEGELVDAEAICGQLVHGSDKSHQGTPAVAQTDSKGADEERKFVTSCVQFAGSLMVHPGVGEEDVRKSCEAHLPSEKKLFCTGYAKLVFQRADATEFSTFCTAEYRRMASAPPVPQAPKPQAAPGHKVVLKKASSIAMNMPNLCMHLFEQAASAPRSGPEFQKAATDLCTRELGQLPPPQRPPAARIRVGCRFFAGRLVSMKQQDGLPQNSTAFCANIAAPHVSGVKRRAPPPAVVVAAPVAHMAPPPAMQAAKVPIIAVERKSPVQIHSVSTPPAVKEPVAPAKSIVLPSEAIPLPTVAADAALPALAVAASAAVPPPPSPQEAAKVKSDEDFLSKFLNKYEQNNAVAEAVAQRITTQQPTIKVFRDEEMAEVRRKAEQLFGNDVDNTADAGALPAGAPAASTVNQAATQPQPPLPPPPSPKPMVVAEVTPAAAPDAASTAPSGAGKKPTVMMALDTQADTNSDFLSSFLSAYKGPLQPGSAPLASPAAPSASATAPAALPSITALLQEPATSEVDSLVSSFLARN